MIEVTGRWQWKRYTGYRGGEACLIGAVTRIHVGSAVAFVRENLRLHNSFYISSHARLGICGNGYSESPLNNYGHQVLELACQPADWEQLCVQVHNADALSRPVIRSKQWTLKIALAFIARTTPTT